MPDENIFTAHSIYTNKGVYALLLGSGISRPSGIPTGWDIVFDLINRIAVLQHAENMTNPEKWFEDSFSQSPNYSNIIEKLTNTPEERINLLRPYIEPSEDELEQGLKQPTKAHQHIAYLVKKGYIKVIVTTNFDRLMENALKAIGIEPTIIANPGQIENTMPLIHSKITLVKINGDYLDNKFLNIKSELTDYDSRMECLLKEIFENFGLITCGWSAKWDNALVEILKSSNKFRFSNFFTYIGKWSEEIENLARFRKGKLLQISSGDNFFSEISENIEALERNEIHPLTKELSIARLKKYISSENYRIQLHDLFVDEVEKTYIKINSDPDFSSPTHVNILSNIEFYIKETDTLRALLIQGIYWGKDYHWEFWTKGLLRISYPKKRDGIFDFWFTLQFLPSVLLIYTAGIAALLKKDFCFLKILLSLKVIDRNDQRQSILYNSNPGSLIASKTLNEAFHQNYLVPVNELLFRKIKPDFDDLVPTDTEYESLFDYFEIITALFYLKLNGKSGFPLGRFRYRRRNNHLIITIKSDFEAEKGHHELVKSGLFLNYEELIDNYTYLMSRVNNMSDF